MASGILQGARNIVLNNPQLNDNSTTTIRSVSNFIFTERRGLELLLNESIQGAFHDSSARHPPPKCHPNTRKDFIDKVMNWAIGTPQYPQRILWMQGPAGSGKSALAQSCAERLAEENMLGATLFFSRPNTRDDSNKLFTSLSYQIATKFRSYGDILDREILNNPNLLTKSITHQFQDLFVKPLQELRARGKGIEQRVMIIDGLDECADIDAQCEIVDIIAMSVRCGTTPFRWAFFSRPDPHITASFKSNLVLPLSLYMELPVSREIDYEILCYLTDEFKKIRERHGLPASWPSEAALEIIVTRSGGLFIYAATIIRFVAERNSLGPDDQLRAVLALSTFAEGWSRSRHPLEELDLFYILIMRHIPPKVLPVIQKILLLWSIDRDWYLYVYANVLGFSEPQVLNAFGYLRSVLELESGLDADINFYHVSFPEFIQDPERSKEFCVYSGCLDVTRRELLESLSNVHSQSIGGSIHIRFTWPHPSMDDEDAYQRLFQFFFMLLQSSRPLEPSISTALVNFRFQMIPRLWSDMHLPNYDLSLEKLRHNIPTEFRDKIIRLSKSPWLKSYMWKSAGPNRLYVLGNGKNKAICWESPGGLEFAPYPSKSEFLFRSRP